MAAFTRPGCFTVMSASGFSPAPHHSPVFRRLGWCCLEVRLVDEEELEPPLHRQVLADARKLLALAVMVDAAERPHSAAEETQTALLQTAEYRAVDGGVPGEALRQHAC